MKEESQENLCKSLDVSAMLKCSKIDLMPGESKTVLFRKDVKQPQSRSLYNIIGVDDVRQRQRGNRPTRQVSKGQAG